MEPKIKVCIDAWDDPEFRTAFEAAYRQVIDEELALDLPETAHRAQRLLRDVGYPEARVVLERSVDEAMTHAAHWSVYRGSVLPVSVR